jgi:trehalose synthase
VLETANLDDDATLTNTRLAEHEGGSTDTELRRLRGAAAALRGLRVLHVSATGYGGGVAELLRSQVPVLRRLGLHVDWKLLRAGTPFFTATKKIHNGLQGSAVELTPDDVAVYRDESAANARLLARESARYDVIVVHDPQPLALVDFHGRRHCRWIWRCHLDSSAAHAPTWALLRPYVAAFDAAVFTLEAFIPAGLPIGRVAVIPPAIDPASPKNIPLPGRTARCVLQWLGLDVRRPIITQVSRFDAWKDPLGVIEAYRQVKRACPDVQLALVGSMALDDPEGWAIYQDVTAAAARDRDIHVFNNLTGAGNIEVNALQRLSRVVVQKSIREGFGLTVSEALWKGTPVVATRTGGIPLQLPPESSGCLVDTVDGCADAIARLLRDPEAAERHGSLGREHVRASFLLPRLVEDELRLYSSALERTAEAGAGRLGWERCAVPA